MDIPCSCCFYQRSRISRNEMLHHNGLVNSLCDVIVGIPICLRKAEILFLILFFLHSSLVIPNAEATSQEIYAWLPDTWGECVSTSCGDLGRQFREVHCVSDPPERLVLPSYCNPATKPDLSRSCFKKCQNGERTMSTRRNRRQTGAKWEAGPWQECEGECGEDAFQERDVKCVLLDRQWTSVHTWCNATAKPASRRSCFKICPDIHRGKYDWMTTEWGECTIADTMKTLDGMEDQCGLGFVSVGSQTRELMCVDVKNITKTVENSVCSRFKPSPADVRPCTVPCPINCATSNWGDWSECSRTCGKGAQYRTRSVLTQPKYGGQECPALFSSRSCSEPSEPCDPILREYFSHIFKFGAWTECKKARLDISRTNGRRRNSKEKRKKREMVDKSLVGGRKREISCYDDGLMLGNSITMEETCLLSRDCEVTLWSQWSDCAVECGQRGNRTRTRDVVTLPGGPDAHECPHLFEIEDCESAVDKNCNRYTWVTGDWNDCSTFKSQNSTCGGGLQTRYVYCVIRNEFTMYRATSAFEKDGKERLKEWAKMKPVDDEFCDEAYKPVTWRECDVPCPPMCEVGPWSYWSDCAPEKCSTELEEPQSLRSSRSRKKNVISGFKIRTRKNLDSTNKEEGCPHMKEYIPCEDSRCYRWHVDAISVCIAREGHCGLGDRVQTVVCKDKWGKEVDERLCKKSPAAPVINSSIPCHVPCSSDCVVGDWSSWSPCTSDCKRGRRESGQQTRFREVLANPGPGGKPCPAVTELLEKRPCNQHKCSIYYWDIGPWTECVVKKNVSPLPPRTRPGDMGIMSDDGNASHTLYFPPEASEQVCGKGYQTRNVTCHKKDSDTVNDKLCGKPRPVISRDCTMPCKKDCVMSEWGEWSSCEKECERAMENGQGISEPVHQVSRRAVIQPRSRQGIPCELRKTRQRLCQCTDFRWHASKWSECVKVSGTNSIFSKIRDDEELRCPGVMTRQINCQRVTSDSEITAVNARYCYQHIGRSPPSPVRRCLVKCQQDRNFSDWMDRIKCQATLRNMESTLEIFRFPNLIYRNHSYTKMQKTAKPVGEWSSCNISKTDSSSPSSLNQESEPYCGVGVRRRAMACFVAGTDIIVDNSYCQYTEFHYESCMIPCPVDCQMSKWTAWGECGVSPDDGMTSISEGYGALCGNQFQFRRRFPIRNAGYGGRSCGAIDSSGKEHELRLCHNICDERFWVAGAWEKCSISRSSSFSNCGNGGQPRAAECYKTDRGSGYFNVARIQSDLRICDMVEMPFGYRNCTYPCVGECVFSEWSSWQKCEAKNGESSCSGHRKRTRNVLRQMPPETRLRRSYCENHEKTVQKERCVLNDNCIEYRAAWTRWSDCQLPAGAKCGTGVKRRKSNCISSKSSLPVHSHKCLENGVLLPKSEHEECHVTCPIDCQMSEWSAWSSCSDECNGLSTKTRTRKVLRKPNMLGRSCPVAVETTPCPPGPCHYWQLEDWSECKIPGGNCGTGLMIRNVTCIQNDGVVVGSSLCESEQGDVDLWFKDSELQQDCEIPCSVQCVLTEWSSWSTCHLPCINDTTPVAGVKTGTRTRSRVGILLGQLGSNNCPPKEIEEKPCDLLDGKCYFYKWMATVLKDGQRSVWCQRTIDGINVSSGCNDDLKPGEDVQCEQDCTEVKNAYCSDNGVCKCAKHHIPKTKASGKLLSCDEIPPNDVSVIPQVFESRIDESITDQADFTKAIITEETTTVEKEIKKSSFLDNLGIFDEDGKVKVWVYGAIAGIVVVIIFIIAAIYLMCAACRKKKPPQTYGLYSTKKQ